MNGYRTGAPCEFCDEIAEVMCPRCQCQVCEKHRSRPEARHCAMCAKEARDDADVARFRDHVVVVDASTSSLGRGRSAPLFEIVVGWLGRLVFGTTAQPETEPELPFDQRTPEDIRAWRRKAGVRTRS